MKFPRKEYWESFINQVPLNTLAKDLNASWDPSSNSYLNSKELEKPILDFLENKYGKKNFSVLDFGCGLGRNTDYLNSISKELYSFDLPSMVDKVKNLKNMPNIFSDWNSIPLKNIDVVYECTVFQHLDSDILYNTLVDIKENCSYLYSYTRVYNDTGRDFRNSSGGLNIASMIANLKAFKPLFCSTSLENISSKYDETHYSILYEIVK